MTCDVPYKRAPHRHGADMDVSKCTSSDNKERKEAMTYVGSRLRWSGCGWLWLAVVLAVVLAVMELYTEKAAF